MNARRVRYTAAVALTVLVGLASRKYLPVSTFFIGSVLWATMVYLAVRGALLTARRRTVVLITIAACIFVEVIHLAGSPLVDSIARHRFGKLVIGQGFSFSDLMWYGVGIVLGYMLEPLVERKR